MRTGQLRQPCGSCQGCAAPLRRTRLTQTAALARRQPVILANWNPLGGKGGGSNKDKEDAARRALEQSFGAKKFGADAGKKAAGKPAPPPVTKPVSKPEPPKNPLQGMFGGGAGAGGPSGGGGGGGGGGSGGGGGGFFSGGGASQPGGEQPIHEEFLDFMRGSWVLLSNLALFLAFSSFLHRSLEWFVGTQLLVAVGAPQQAGERVVGKFFELIEWFERTVLGWKLPGDDEEENNHMKVYEVLQYYTPVEAAYTFAQYKYKLSEAEKEMFMKAYALRYFERRDGQRGDVDPVALQAVKDRLEPLEADRRAYQRAKAAGKLEEYWAAEGREQTYQRIVGQPRTA